MNIGPDDLKPVTHALGVNKAGPPEIPRTPSKIGDIPGLGPIRVRALTKAGYSDLADLRAASLDSLLAVPGLTEIKARHIQQFLAAFSLDDLRSASEAPESLPNQGKGQGNSETLVPTVAPAVFPEKVSDVVAGAVRVMGEVVQILLSPEAPLFRSRLLRVLGVLAQRSESLAIDAWHLAEDHQDRAVRRFKRASKALAEFGGSHTDKKAQGRLAEDLEILNEKLAECRLTGKDTSGEN